MSKYHLLKKEKINVKCDIILERENWMKITWNYPWWTVSTWYVTYATCEDKTEIKWLPLPERINFTIAKLIYKGLLKESLPKNLEIQVRNLNLSLRIPNKVTLEYLNLPKEQSFSINYANMLYTEQNKKNVNIQQQLIS